MRTTLTLEPDVALQVKRLMADKKLTLKRAVNDALRAGLPALRRQVEPPPFKVEPFNLGRLKPGIDETKLGQYLDQLDVEEFLRKNPELARKNAEASRKPSRRKVS